MRTVVLIGGLPGSGKSTAAAAYERALLVPAICEADQFFMVDGVYTFDPAKIGAAHADCQQRVSDHMEAWHPFIVVANTFSQRWERAVYQILAHAWSYEVENRDLFDAGLTDAELAARCVHGVPVEQIAKMRARWER